MIKGKNRVVVFCPPNLDSFVTPIIGELRQWYNMYLFSGGAQYEFNELIKHCNVGWFEWCLEHFASGTNYAKSCKVIGRMHSFEAFTDHPATINWNNVDRLIIPNASVLEVNSFYKSFVSQKLKKQQHDISPENMPPFIPSNKVNVIHNPVNTNKFKFIKNRTFKKKICFVGHINFKKNFEYALNLFHDIKKVDNEYTFHIAGDFQEPRDALYLDRFMHHHKYEPGKDIYIYDWIDNINEFYADMDFIISSSLYESFHLSIAEAMSTGVIPLIYNWYGSEYIYPKEFLFTDNSSFMKLILSVQNHKDIEDIRKSVSKYINLNFSYNVIIPQFKEQLDYLCYGDMVLKHCKDNKIDNLSAKETLENIALKLKLDFNEVKNCCLGFRQDEIYNGELCE